TEPSDEIRRIEQRVAAGWNGIDEGDDVPTPDRAVHRPPSVLPSALRLSGVLVGRREEMSILVGAAHDALRGGPQVVLLPGAAGGLGGGGGGEGQGARARGTGPRALPAGGRAGALRRWRRFRPRAVPAVPRNRGRTGRQPSSRGARRARGELWRRPAHADATT